MHFLVLAALERMMASRAPRWSIELLTYNYSGYGLRSTRELSFYGGVNPKSRRAGLELQLYHPRVTNMLRP